MSDDITIEIELFVKAYDTEKLQDCLDECKKLFYKSRRAREFFTADCTGIEFVIVDTSADFTPQEGIDFDPSAFLFVKFKSDPASVLNAEFFDYDDMNRGWVEGMIEASIAPAKIISIQNEQ